MIDVNKNKKIIIITIISLIVLTGIYLLYNTYALTTKVTNNDGYYTIELTDSNIVSLKANEEKTAICQINNTNNGTVSYGVAYNNSNIEVKVYSDSKDKVTGTIGANDNKYVKLHLKNKTSSNTTVEITAVMGYENGGDLIVPSDSTLVTGTYTAPISLTKYITNLYANASKSTVTNNSITYNYATSESLMNDRLGGTTSSLDGGNIRYYGATPNNYVYFNCESYPSTNCELWRIIGVFDGKIKLIRNSSIGRYSWDTSAREVGSGSGVNEWSQADLMKLLNPGYTKESVNNSLYYNSKGGQCYAGANNAETPCDFTYTGIKNDTTRNMIADAKWSLLGWLDEGANVYADQSYKLENTSGTVYTGNKTSWTGKIALPYPSDYAYSAYLGKCTSTLGEYSNCSSWMKTMFNSKTIALLTPIVSSSFVFHVAGGCLDLGEPYAALDSEIFPTLYLNANVSIKTGSGTLNSPYQLSVG